jgi:microcystin-dependent protein
MDPYIGEIRCFGFGKTPDGWLPCNGQTLEIQKYAALYSLLGTHFGGDGTNTFGLPDLRGRVPIHFNPAASPPVNVGTSGGVETVTLVSTQTCSQLPQHTHTVAVSDTTATNPTPSGCYLSNPPSPHEPYAPAPSGSFPLDALAPDTVSVAGANQSHSNMQPYLVLNFCIATTGIYPSRP